MAEAIVFSVLQKLADVVIQEAIFLYGVKDQVDVMKRELVRIQCFLKDADSKRKSNHSAQNWVKEVRDVSYWIEDVIEIFLIEVQQIPPKKPGLINKVKRLGKKPQTAILMHNLGDEIIKIQARITEIYDSTTRYGINRDMEKSSGEMENLFKRKPVVPNIDEDIIGFDVEKKEIIEHLLDQKVLKRRVLSIVGQGGLGKTTLAKKVYNSADVKNHFDVRTWLTISQEVKPIQLLKDVLRELGMGNSDGDEKYFIGEIHNTLSNKRYLVVLDDIWKDDVWNNLFQQAFPDNKNGSRVLITTRFVTIAKMADPKGVHELRFMNNEESLELLLEKAFPKENASESYPPDLYELATKFLKPCGGLPLALVVVGGLLSIKLPNYNACEKVLNSMNWQIEGNQCSEIIATSYEDLPLPLKSCFIYLASFSEDYIIDARLLIMMWIAEGFISNEGNKTMDDTAEQYLEELAQRCMIRVSKRSLINGSIKQFSVHDLLLDLAIDEAKQTNFLKVSSKPIDFQSIGDARRATFQLEDSSWDNASFEKNLTGYTKPNVRTIIFFGKVIPFDSQFKLLKVLMIIKYYSGFNQKTDMNDNLKGLLHLKCLIFKESHFKDDFILFVDHLHNLQTLHIEDCHGIKVHLAFSRMKSLRHVSSIGIQIDSGIQIGSDIDGPINLPYLRTLNLIITHISQIKNFHANMPSLQNLALYNQTNSWELIDKFIGNLNCLVSLSIRSEREIPLEFFDTRAFPWYQNLETLSLDQGCKSEGTRINTDMFPPRLNKLVLSGCKIDQDPMPILGKLKSLKTLKLGINSYRGKQMIIVMGAFPQLQKLVLYHLFWLEECKIEEGAMPMLSNLKLVWCGNLKMLPDLQHVLTLKVIHLAGMEPEFDLRVQNEDQHKIKHIPSIIFTKI